MPKLLIVIGSTRPGRVGLPVANWFYERALEHDAFEVELADLAELDLPLLNEPNHPRLRQYTLKHTHEWSAIVDSADAVVLVTSEYNWSFPAPLKNAIDYLNQEWRHKPVGFVSYGGVSAGTRAVSQLRQVVPAVQLLPVAAGVYIPFVTQFLDDNGEIQANPVMIQAAAEMLDELAAVEQALRGLRERARG